MRFGFPPKPSPLTGNEPNQKHTAPTRECNWSCGGGDLNLSFLWAMPFCQEMRGNPDIRNLGGHDQDKQKDKTPHSLNDMPIHKCYAQQDRSRTPPTEFDHSVSRTTFWTLPFERRWMRSCPGALDGQGRPKMSQVP